MSKEESTKKGETFDSVGIGWLAAKECQRKKKVKVVRKGRRLIGKVAAKDSEQSDDDDKRRSGGKQTVGAFDKKRTNANKRRTQNDDGRSVCV
jgi:hypothetical protein